MHIGLRQSYYEAMVSTGLGIMVLTAYVTTRTDLDPFVQAPFDLLVLTFSGITVIGGLIKRTHCIRLNEDVKEGHFEKCKFKLLKSGHIIPHFYAVFDKPYGEGKEQLDSIRLIPKSSNRKYFDGRELDADLVIDQAKNIPIAVHFDEKFIFAKLSPLSAMPSPMMSSQQLLSERVGKLFILVVLLISMLFMFQNDVTYLVKFQEFQKAFASSNQVKEKMAQQLIEQGSKFNRYDERQLVSKIKASNYFSEIGEHNKAINAIELAKTQSANLAETNLWRCYTLSNLGVALARADRFKEALNPLESCLKQLNKSENNDLLVPIIGWWQYRESNKAQIEQQAYTALSIAYDLTGDATKAESSYNLLITRETEIKNTNGAQLGMLNLSNFLNRKGKLEEAKKQLNQVVASARTQSKNKAKKTARRLVQLGLWCFERNYLDSAEFLLRKALEINEKENKGALPLALNLNVLAEILKIEKHYDEAKPMFESSLKILEKEKTSAEYTWPLLSLEDIKIAQGEDENSLNVIDKIYKTRTLVFGKDNERTYAPIHSKANYLKKHNKLDDSIPLYKEVLEKREAMLGSHHPQTIDVRGDYIDALQKAGRKDEADRENLILEKSLRQPTF